MELDVHELAELSGFSVETIRGYQTRGLLPAPRRAGRVAWYSDHHVARLRRIRALREEGYSLRVIADLLDHDRLGEGPPDGDEEPLTLAEVADRAGVPPAMIRSLRSSGLLRPLRIGRSTQFTEADARAVRLLLALIGPGLPVEELTDAARPHLEELDRLAERAADLFIRFGRAPLLDAGLSRREEADRMVASLRLLVHAVTELSAYHFRRRILDDVKAFIDREGTPSERAALAREVTGPR